MKNGFKLHTIKNLDENNVLCIVLIENCTRNIWVARKTFNRQYKANFHLHTLKVKIMISK